MKKDEDSCYDGMIPVYKYEDGRLEVVRELWKGSTIEMVNPVMCKLMYSGWRSIWNQ